MARNCIRVAASRRQVQLPTNALPDLSIGYNRYVQTPADLISKCVVSAFKTCSVLLLKYLLFHSYKYIPVRP